MRVFALLLGLLVFQATAAEKPKIVFIAGDYEYESRQTLPEFARELERDYAVETVVLKRPDDEKDHTIPGLEALETADLAVIFIRRMVLPAAELNRIRKYVDSGKPLVGLRTASHSFENWKEFDREVLGGNYGLHFGNKLKTTVSMIPEAKEHPILKGFEGFISDGSLYKNTPLQPGAKPLLMGKVEGQPSQPVAWTHQYKGGRVFYTSLGHPNDFKGDSFRRLVRNGIEWTLNRPLEKREVK